MWTEKSIKTLVERQRAFFKTGATLDIDWRIRRLKSLKASIKAHEKEIMAAMATTKAIMSATPVIRQ